MADVVSKGSGGSCGGRPDGRVRIAEATDDGGDEFGQVRIERGTMEGGERSEEFKGGDAYGGAVGGRCGGKRVNEQRECVGG